MHLSGEETVRKRVSDGFVFDEWLSKILPNVFQNSIFSKIKKKIRVRKLSVILSNVGIINPNSTVLTACR